MVVLSFFGSPHITVADQAVDLDTRKAMALLAYLCATQREHSRHSLATLLWPDYPQSRALANLRRTLWSINTHLPVNVLQVSRQTLAIDLDRSVSVDVCQFKQAIAASQVPGIDHQVVAAYLQAAIDLYQADFLEGWHLEDSTLFQEWAFLETEHLRGMVSQACDRFVAWALDTNVFAQAIQYAQRWISIDPLHEPAHCQLMIAYDLSGQPSAALHQYQECVRLLQQDIGLPPMQETTRLYEQIKSQIRHSHTEPVKRSLQPLPGSAMPFIGRVPELEQLSRLLVDTDACRLVTITGPGGAGKTRLAVRCAELLRSHFTDDVLFVDLSAIDSLERSWLALADVLAFEHIPAAQLKQSIIEYLSSQNLLIIWDNTEQVRDFSMVIYTLLNATADTKHIITSRQRLLLPEEWVISIEGLTVPLAEDYHMLADVPASALFMQSAQRVYSQWQVQPDDLTAIIEICQTLEGLPLAIDLAAAWVSVLSCPEIAVEIQHNLDFLTTNLHHIPERQRSLRAVFEYSWSLLSSEEQVVLKSLAIFRSRFTREAATEVAYAKLPMVLNLVGKSLVIRYGDGRFGLSDSIRQYATLKLVDDQQHTNALHLRHSEYCLAFAKTANTNITSPQRTRWLQALAQMYDTICEALDWLITNQKTFKALQLATSMWQFWWISGQHRQGRIWIEKILPDSVNIDDLALRSDLYKAHAVLSWSMADYTVAETSFLVALEGYKYIDDQQSIAVTLSNLAGVVLLQGHYIQADSYYSEALGIMQLLGNRLAVATILSNQAATAVYQANYHFAEQLARKSIALYQHLGHEAMSAPPHNNLGRALMYLERFAEAQIVLDQALSMWQEQADKPNMIIAFESLAYLSASNGEYRHAVLLLMAANYFRQQLDIPRPIVDQQCYLENQTKIINAELDIMALMESCDIVFSWEKIIAFALRKMSLSSLILNLGVI